MSHIPTKYKNNVHHQKIRITKSHLVISIEIEFLILWLFGLTLSIISQFFYQLFLMRIENLLLYV